MKKKWTFINNSTMPSTVQIYVTSLKFNNITLILFSQFYAWQKKMRFVEFTSIAQSLPPSNTIIWGIGF